MMLGSNLCGSVALGSKLQDSNLGDTMANRPIMTAWNNVDARDWIATDSISIVDTLGQGCTASLIILNPPTEPIPGDEIQIFYYSFLLYAGTIDSIEKTTEGLRSTSYACSLLDVGQTLVRRKIRRNFVNMTVQAIVDSLLDNELSQEGFSIGTIDARSTMPLVDASKGARVFDVLRDLAGSTGQTLLIGFDQTINFLSTTIAAAPVVLNEANALLDATSLVTDRESYRNSQTVIVTGTPPTGSGQEALSVVVERKNQSQIDERKSIEGGSGLYEELEEITHPTSNVAGNLTLLGIGYANLRLAIAGATRLTFTVKARGYGFRAGQIASVDLPTFGLTGTYVIQRVSITELAAKELFHTLELTSTSQQRRSYESWLSVVKAGKVTIAPPSSITNNVQDFITPGADSFTVPAGVFSVEVECTGASAGGGGGAQFNGMNGLVYDPATGAIAPSTFGRNGGKGGTSGRAITVVLVSPGDVLTLFIGSAGLKGVSDANTFNQFMGVGVPDSTTATNGTDGTLSTVTYLGAVVCQGNPGKKGLHPTVTITRIDPVDYDLTYTANGAKGANGNGVGDAVFVAGGFIGGIAGTGNPLVAPKDGVDGKITVRW